MTTASADQFRERLDILCQKNGGRRAFAEAAGLPYSSLARYFTHSEPPRAVLEKLVRAGGVSADWLLMGADSAPESECFSTRRLRTRFSAKLAELLRKQLPRSEPAKALAGATGLSILAAHEILDGDEPTLEELSRIAAAFRAAITDLARDGGLSFSSSIYLVPKFSFDHFISAHATPEYSYTRTASGADKEHPVAMAEDHWAGSRQWLKNISSGNLDSLVYDVVDTDEIGSTAPRGSLVIVDLSQNEVRGGIYLVKLNGAKRFRRVRLEDGEMKLVSLVSEDSAEPTILRSVQDIRKQSMLIGRICSVIRGPV